MPDSADCLKTEFSPVGPVLVPVQFALTRYCLAGTYGFAEIKSGYRRKTMRLFIEFRKMSRFLLLACIAGTCSFCANLNAQGTPFYSPVTPQASSPGTTFSSAPGTYPIQQATYQAPTIITTPQSQTTVPSGVLQQPSFVPYGGAQPGAVAYPNAGAPGLPAFDPYQTPTQALPGFPTTSQPASIAPQITYPPGFQAPANQQYGVPTLTNGPTFRGTDSNGQASVNWNFPQNAWNSVQSDFLPHALDRPRITYTYLGSDDLKINDIEFATTAKLKHFFGANQPLRVSPGFILHYWAGPDSTKNPLFDLPAQAYSVYLSLDHITDPSAVWGFDNTVRFGYYSDFSNSSSDGFRVTGKVLVWYRVNPYTVGKIGIEYFDRVDVKMLPAFGVYMTPNSDMKLDLYFPRTKLSQRLPNYNNKEGWVYVGGEYGGGSWVIDRRNGANDQADINDVRAFIGTEWRGPKCHTASLEFGYVFNREIVYRSNANLVLDLEDTVMFRAGFTY